MPILKRRLDICGREKTWEYVVETGGREFHVHARQVARGEPEFDCSCGATTGVSTGSAPGGMFYPGLNPPCSHIAEAQRDLCLARQAAAQMVA